MRLYDKKKKKEKKKSAYDTNCSHFLKFRN